MPHPTACAVKLAVAFEAYGFERTSWRARPLQLAALQDQAVDALAIDVAPDGVSVTLHAAGIRGLVAELAGQEAPALAASEPLLEAPE